jgi:hypothetical protein
MSKSAILATLALLALSGCGKGATDKASADQAAAAEQGAAAEDVLHEQVAAEKSAGMQPESDPAYAYKAVDCVFMLSMIHGSMSVSSPSPDLDNSKQEMESATKIAVGLSLKYGISQPQALQHQSALKAKYEGFLVKKNSGEMTEDELVESIFSDKQKYCKDILGSNTLMKEAIKYNKN